MNDMKLPVLVSLADRYERSRMLLATANSDGTIELLTHAWEPLLGYGRRELEGKALGVLVAAERRLDCGRERIVAALFERGSAASVDVTLRCQGGRRQSLTLHRRLDGATGTIYIVGEKSAVHRASVAAPRDAE